MRKRLSLRRLKLPVGILAVGIVAGLSLPVTGAVAAQHGPQTNTQTPLPVRNGSAQDLGAYNPAQTIRLAIGLKAPHKAAEQQFLNAIQDKHSPLFHHYLTVAQWTARFGPSAAAQNAVVLWAKGAGLTVTNLSPNRLVVDLAGQVGTIEKALGVQINNYKLGTKTFFANNHDPVLPRSLSGIVESVEGMSSLQTMFPAYPTVHEPASPVYSPGPVEALGAHAAANGSRAKLRASHSGKAGAANGAKVHITNGAYDPTDIYSSQAYDYNALYNQGHCCNPLGNPSQSPPQTTIAVATFGSQQLSDITGFHNQYPYLAYAIQEVNIDGTPACCDAEGTMDAEWSTAMSNSFGSFQTTSKVYLYDGANFNDATFTDMYNKMVTDNVARVFSTSWSCTENFGCNSSEMSTRDAIFSEMAGQGWSLVAASGDRGAYDDCSHLSVSFPASDSERGRRWRDRAEPEFRAGVQQRGRLVRRPGRLRFQRRRFRRWLQFGVQRSVLPVQPAMWQWVAGRARHLAERGLVPHSAELLLRRQPVRERRHQHRRARTGRILRPGGFLPAGRGEHLRFRLVRVRTVR